VTGEENDGEETEEKRMPILIYIPRREFFNMIYRRRSAQSKAMVTNLGLVGSGIMFIMCASKNSPLYVGRRNVHFQGTCVVWCCVAIRSDCGCGISYHDRPAIPIAESRGQASTCAANPQLLSRELCTARCASRQRITAQTLPIVSLHFHTSYTSACCSPLIRCTTFHHS
jgi:hypothetical protein